MAEVVTVHGKVKVQGQERQLPVLEKRSTHLDDFKKKVDEFIAAEQTRLEVERNFLKMVQKSQGLSVTTRRSQSMNEIKALAVVTQVKLGDFLSDKGIE